MSRRRTRRRIGTRRLLFFAVFVLAALVGWSFVRVTLQDNTLAREAAAVRAQIAVLETQQALLKVDVAVRETDAYIEQKARDYGYVKSGEGLASVRDANPIPQASVAPGQSTTSRLERWLALFFHP